MGLFLAFTPALLCDRRHERDASLKVSITNADGHRELRTATFPQNSVVIMLGAGAENWLSLPPFMELEATRHAVVMDASSSSSSSRGMRRAWYGMMHLVPST